jgi:hypothetical protein
LVEQGYSSFSRRAKYVRNEAEGENKKTKTKENENEGAKAKRVSVTICPTNWDKRRRHRCNRVLLFHATASMSRTQEQYPPFLNIL